MAQQQLASQPGTGAWRRAMAHPSCVFSSRCVAPRPRRAAGHLQQQRRLPLACMAPSDSSSSSSSSRQHTPVSSGVAVQPPPAAFSAAPVLASAALALSGLALSGTALAEELFGAAPSTAGVVEVQQVQELPTPSTCGSQPVEGDIEAAAGVEGGDAALCSQSSTVFENLVSAVEDGLDGANLAQASILSTLGPSNETVWLNSSNPMCHMWEAYCTVLEEKPVVTQMVTGLLGTFLGDMVAQGSAAFMSGSSKEWQYDVKRLARLVAYSALVSTPTCQAWFHFLDTVIFPDSPTGLAAVLGKVACDQLLMAPILTSVFLAAMKMMEGQPDDVVDTIKTKLKPILMANYSIWPLAHLINFAVVPPSMRILYVNVISIFWSAYMSHAANSSASSQEGAAARQPGPVSRRVLTVLHNRGALERAPSLRGR